MQVIWKFQLKLVSDDQVIAVPKGATILEVACQQGAPTMWALITDGAPVEKRTFRIVPTGEPMDFTGMSYWGSCHDPKGFVWHIFEVLR